MTLHIDSLTTNAGFLRDATIDFNPGLNCIIGARGTCKSTVIETIRFVFDCNQKRVKSLCSAAKETPDYSSTNQGMVLATLGAGVAKCHITQIGPDGHDDFTIEREVETCPRIYRNGIEELSDFEVLHNIEIYSQGDLQEIAQNESLRLELIDRPNKSEIAALETQRRSISNELKSIGSTIRQRGREIEVRRAEVRGLAMFRQQLADLQAARPQLPSELEEERAASVQRKQALDAATRGVEEGVELLESLARANGNETYFADLADSIQLIGTESSTTLSEAFAKLASTQSQIAALIRAVDFSGARIALSELSKDFEARGRKYIQLRQEQQELNESLKKEDTLKKQIEHLSRLQNELDALVVTRKELSEKRANIRVQLQSICDKIHDLREIEVDRINQQHGDVVVLTLNLGAYSQQYSSMLELMLAGSRIRGQDEIAREIAAHFRPSDLINIIEESDSERLSNTLDRDLSQMARVVSYLADNEQLYEIESVVFDDTLDITLYDHGVPKPIGELSKGQMATALLPLILRSAPYPLIFDQPEDDLDNSFIFQTLVQKIQELKTERQLIFVTHNANIPVLGDADSVIVMEMESPTHVGMPTAGSVDHAKSSILSLLEGGSEAFELRHERYGDLLRKTHADVGSNTGRR